LVRDFIGPYCKTGVGPWLLLNSHDEVRAILRWGNITDEELAGNSPHSSSEVVAGQWNGYELRLMKKQESIRRKD
jgi:hypothetical protein